MAKKAIPMSSTPQTEPYDQPISGWSGKIYRDVGAAMGAGRGLAGILGPLDYGVMGRSPQSGYLGMPDAETTPMANPAAVRAYTRNAPYMEEFMSSPRDMLSEMYRLQELIKENPNDVVSQYRARVLRQALGDVFGMQAPDQINEYYKYAQAPSTPSFTPAPSTPRRR